MKPTATPKATLIILVIAVLAVIGIVIYSHRAIKNLPTNTVPETTPTPTSGQWPSTKVRDETVTDKGSYYTINAVYPVTQDDVITGYFKNFVDTSILGFKSDTSWAAGDGASVAPAEADALSLDIKYTEEKDANADNYVFSVTTYTGGAHGLEATKTFSFSAAGRLITVASLFTNGDAGLKTIAPYVQSQLKKMQYADDSMIKDGTTATEDNFSNFIVQTDGVTFIFDPYQVAPYAAGIQKVKVPLSAFQSIANKDLF